MTTNTAPTDAPAAPPLVLDLAEAVSRELVSLKEQIDRGCAIEAVQLEVLRSRVELHRYRDHEAFADPVALDAPRGGLHLLPRRLAGELVALWALGWTDARFRVSLSYGDPVHPVAHITNAEYADLEMSDTLGELLAERGITIDVEQAIAHGMARAAKQGIACSPDRLQDREDSRLPF